MRAEVQEELERNILPYWMEKVTDHEQGGYYGRIDGYDKVHPEAEKGAILNARILWTFSAAYRLLGKKEYLLAAQRALGYILKNFTDPQYGGVFWSLNTDGSVRDAKKQTYAIGFMIYGLSESVRATGDETVLETAIGLYICLEEHAFDKRNIGYIEALKRNWEPIPDMRLSDKDENASRTMNTHLHVIEAYTNLYRVWPASRLAQSIHTLLHIFKTNIIHPETYHLDLFFNDSWEGKRNIQSFGHDIEASWLLYETALVLGEKKVLEEITPIIQKMAHAAMEGVQEDGSMIYEKWTDTGHVDEQRQWWVMCENIIGNLNFYQHFGDEDALRRAFACWLFTKEKLIDHKNGEWFWSIGPDGFVNRAEDKAGFWKCPYHNSRMCFEVMERFSDK